MQQYKKITNAWEQRKVFSIATQFLGGGTPSTSNEDFWQGDIPWLQSSDIQEDKVIGATPKKHISVLAVRSSATQVVPANSIAVITRVGVGKLAFIPFSYTTSQDFLSLCGLKIDALFGVYALYKKMQEDLHAVQGTSIKGITKEEFLSKQISIPESKEQRAIGNILVTIDNLITLHRCKDFGKKNIFWTILSHLLFIKKTTTWEQRKLGESVQITMGQSPDGSTYSDEPSDYILVQGNADLQNGWVKPRVWTTQITKKAYAGDLIMSVRAPAGAMGKTAYNAVIGRGVAAIRGNEFVFQSLVKMDLEGFWKKLSCGSTFESLNSDTIANAEIYFPSQDEQKAIGELLLGIDNLITLHQRGNNYIQENKK